MAKVDDFPTGTRVMPDFPSNNKRTLLEPEKPELPEKKVSKVVNGAVRQKKKSLGRKFADLFIGEEVTDVKGYLLQDVIVPAIKNMVIDTVQDGIEIVLYGEVKNRSRRSASRSKSGFVDYGGYYSPDRRRQEERRQQRSSCSMDFNDIVLASRVDAEEVISTLADLIADFGQATVADLMDAVGMTGQWTDHYWGWTNISTAVPKRVRDGWILTLPKPENLKVN